MSSGDLDISVVVACRNEIPSIHECIEALTTQTYPSGRFELIFVDGGSTDGTREALEIVDGRVFSDNGGGPGAARNVGIRHARAGIVAFTDGDCVPRKDWLSNLGVAFGEDGAPAGVAGTLRMPRKTMFGRLADNDARVHYRGYITSNVAYRRQVLHEMGGFDERLRCGEDWDLAWRTMDAGHVVTFDPRPVVLHATPEAQGRLRDYLAKEVWYGRHDVPMQLGALRRALCDGAASPGSRQALKSIGTAASHAAWVAAIGGSAACMMPMVAALGVAGAAFGATRHTLRAVDVDPAGRRALPQFIALATAKRLARGVGTLTGLAEAAAERAFNGHGPGAQGPEAGLPMAQRHAAPPRWHA